MLGLLLIASAEVHQISGGTSKTEGRWTVVKNYEASTGAGISNGQSKNLDYLDGRTCMPYENGTQWPKDQDESITVLLREIKLSLEHETKSLFRDLFTARGRERDLIRNTLVHKSTPTLIAMAAIREFQQKGNEDRLSLASSILADAPIDELLVSLRQLANEDSPESYAFIGLLNTHEISNEERNNILTRFTQSQHIDVSDAAMAILEGSE